MLIAPKGHVLYLPVETAARELDAKLLLALHAARAGASPASSRALATGSRHGTRRDWSG